MVCCLLGPHSEKGPPGHHSLSLTVLRAKGCLSGAISLWTSFITKPTSLTHLHPPPASVITAQKCFRVEFSPAWQPLLGAERARNIFFLVFPHLFTAAKTEGHQGSQNPVYRKLRIRDGSFQSLKYSDQRRTGRGTAVAGMAGREAGIRPSSSPTPSPPLSPTVLKKH